MVPKIIVIDPEYLEGGKPAKGVAIHSDHLRVHPEEFLKAHEGLKLTMGDVFTVIQVEEYKRALN